jgi:outer membrane lipoprotein LolB
MRSLGGHAARAASFCCTLGLATCAGLTPTPPASSVVFAAALPSFEAAGRLSVRHGSDALTANFRWQRDGNRDEVDLASPLGQTIARLTGDGDGVALRTADGRVATGSDWAALTAQSLGWPLPVDGLAFWIQGAPRRPGRRWRRSPGMMDGRVCCARTAGRFFTSRSLRARTTPAALHA